MSYGVTESGFVRKTHNEILADLEAQARARFGADVDLSAFSPIGAFIQILADELNTQWQIAEDTYYSSFLDTSEGASLDRVVRIGGQSRKAQRRATVDLTFTGTNGSVVPVGMQAKTSQGVVFEVTEAGTIAAGTVTVPARAVLPGTSGLVASSQITSIVTPEAGVDTVTNSSASTGGEARESDTELRERYLTRGISGGSSIPAIEAELNQIASVTRAIVYENAGNTTDGEGRPPHSIEALVIGGTPTEIANAIFQKKPAGIELLGSQTFNVTDANDEVHVVRWNEPTERQIFVVYEVTSNAAWADTQKVTMRTEAVKLIGGSDTVGAITQEYEGLNIGDDVLTWKLEAAQDELAGIELIEAIVAADDEDEVTGLTIDTITNPTGNTYRYNFSGTPDLTAVSVGDVFYVTGATSAINNGPFKVEAKGSYYIEVINNEGLTQGAPAGTGEVYSGHTDKIDNTSRDLARTETAKIGVKVV